MNRDFLELFMEKTSFPEEARQELRRCNQLLDGAGLGEALQGAASFFYHSQCSVKAVEPLLQGVAASSGISVYTVWLLFLMQAAQRARRDYLAQGVCEEIFWDTFCDLRYKLLECKTIHGVWGNFVASWYPIFYTCQIVKLGRLEFENAVYEEEEPYEGHGILLRKGDPVKSIHIPSSGEPFGLEARLDSYRRAYAFFQEELQGKPLVCTCHSWLLYPPYNQVFSPTGNTADFRKDFQILGGEAQEAFHDAWRVFGADYQKPVEELPEKTSMQRAFKAWLSAGQKPGEGFGVLVFDGERLLTR